MLPIASKYYREIYQERESQSHDADFIIVLFKKSPPQL